jgi:hypothetical protein
MDYMGGYVAIQSFPGDLSDGPGAYQANAACQWTLTGSQRIILSWSTISLESGYDFVKIYDGVLATSPLLMTLTGQLSAGSVTSTGSTAVVRFTSDASVQLDGFVIRYAYASGQPSVPSLVPPSAPSLLPPSLSAPLTSPTPTVAPVFASPAGGGSQCSGAQSLSGSSGQISDGPGAYSANAQCSWSIVSTSPIVLRFLQLDLESGYDFVTIYAGSQPSGSPIASVSGQALPTPISTGSTQVSIRFTSDSSVQVRPPQHIRWMIPPALLSRLYSHFLAAGPGVQYRVVVGDWHNAGHWHNGVVAATELGSVSAFGLILDVSRLPTASARVCAERHDLQWAG